MVVVARALTGKDVGSILGLSWSLTKRGSALASVKFDGQSMWQTVGGLIAARDAFSYAVGLPQLVAVPSLPLVARATEVLSATELPIAQCTMHSIQ